MRSVIDFNSVSENAPPRMTTLLPWSSRHEAVSGDLPLLDSSCRLGIRFGRKSLCAKFHGGVGSSIIEPRALVTRGSELDGSPSEFTPNHDVVRAYR